MWVLPSRRRPHDLARFFEACDRTKITTPGIVLVQNDEITQLWTAYSSLKLPAGWQIIGTASDKQGPKMREVRPFYIDSNWIGQLEDDMVPETPEWDARLIAQLDGTNFVTSHDGWQVRNSIFDSRMHGAKVWSGALVRTVGGIWPQDLDHLYIDDLWEGLGRETGCWTLDRNVMVRHVNRLKEENRDKIDETAALSYSPERWAHDRAVYDRWVEEDRTRCVVAINHLRASR